MFRVSLILISLILQTLSIPLRDSSAGSFDKESPMRDFVALKRVKRSEAKIDESYRWPNHTIPYRINMTSLTEEHVAQIDKAIQSIQNLTCVRFVNHTNELDFVTIIAAKQCRSKVGRRGGEQFIKLDIEPYKNCFRVVSVIHELMHALGFYHMHKRTDRDNYLKIYWENVLPDLAHKLEKRTDDELLTDFGIGYDPESIMHYSRLAFTKNGNITIETIDGLLNDKLGQREELSDGDVLRIRKMFKCDE